MALPSYAPCVTVALPLRSAYFLGLVDDLRHVRDGGARACVDQREHSVQCATRAVLDGADDELVCVALLHDAFRVVAPATHGEALAEAIGDRLTPGRVAVLRHHSAWQHDALNGTRRAEAYIHRGWYADGCALGRWDAASFEAGYPALPLSWFADRVRALLD